MRALWLVVGLSLVACGDEDEREPTLEERCAAADEEAGIVRPEGWAPLSHCKFAPADHATVFPADVVGTMTIRMSAAEYAAMQKDLEDLFGEPPVPTVPSAPCRDKDERDLCQIDVGDGLEPGICVLWTEDLLACVPDTWRSPAAWRAACEGKSESESCTVAGSHDGQCWSDGIDTACRPAFDEPSDQDPCAGRAEGESCRAGSKDGVCVATSRMKVCQADGFDPADVTRTPPEAAAPFWPREPEYFHADVEYAGAVFTNVGIRYKGNNGLQSADGRKNPFRLKLDEWEDEDRGVTDQRLFGFQDLSFSPNHTDPSNLHSVLAAELFRGAGVPAPHVVFVEVKLDTGNGPELLGLYAMAELPDDQLPETVFASDDGNIYKPDGRGAHFVSFVAASMHKKNNDEGGFDDVKAFLAALHAPQAERDTWRADLQAVFDMEGFARFYAINQAIANWDTYGGLAHNFYLYNHDGRLHFIPWDFDLAFERSGPSDLSLRLFDGEWPLIQAVARDASLFAVYLDTLAAFDAAQLDSGKLLARVDALATLVRPAIERENEVREEVLERFDFAMVELRNHVMSQDGQVTAFLAGQPAKPRRKTARDALLRGGDQAAKRRWMQALSGGHRPHGAGPLGGAGSAAQPPTASR